MNPMKRMTGLRRVNWGIQMKRRNELKLMNCVKQMKRQKKQTMKKKQRASDIFFSSLKLNWEMDQINEVGSGK